MKTTLRTLALLLCCCLFFGALAEATPSDIITEAPATDAPTVSPETEAPADAPQTEQSETEAPATEAPETDIPTEAPTDEPTEIPPPEAPTPEAPVTDAPTEGAASTSPEAWRIWYGVKGEIDWTGAPASDKAEADWVRADANGLPVPMDARGAWLLDTLDSMLRKEAESPVRERSVRDIPIDLNKADATLYRSGSYTVRLGAGRERTKLTVAPNRLIVLVLEQADITALDIGANTAVTVHTRGQNAVGTLTLGQKTKLTFASGGALTIQTVQRPQGAENAAVLVTGGSVNAELEESENRKKTVFTAAGMTHATVDGEAYPADTADADGKIYLYLPTPADGLIWHGQLNGDALEVSRVNDTGDTPQPVAPGTEQVISAPGLYPVEGAVAAGTVLRVESDQVRILLKNASGALTAPLIKTDRDVTLLLEGDSVLSGTLAEGNGKLHISGTGSLKTGAIGTAARFASGSAVLDTVPAGHTALAVDGLPAQPTVELNHQPYAAVLTSDGRLILPEAPADQLYTARVEDTKVIVTARSNAEEHFDLAVTPAVTTSARRWTVQGAESAAAGSIRSRAEASGQFQSVKLHGAGGLLTADAPLDLHTSGINELTATGMDAVRGEISITTDSGRLDISGQSNIGSLRLKGNIRVRPARTDAVKVTVKRRDGSAAANQPLTVRIGGAAYAMTTFEDGTLHLHGFGDLSGQAIAAANGEQVFTAVVQDGESDANETIAVGKPEFEDRADGSVIVSFSAPAASAFALSYRVGDAEQALPDTFDPNAVTVSGGKARFVLKDIAPGAVITARAAASAEENAKLTESSADGFCFSETAAHTHRVPFTTEEKLNRPYNGKVYKPPFELKAGWTVAYEGEKLRRDGTAVAVGEYKLHLTVPDGDPLYLPGVYHLDFKIEKIELLILPEPNQEKYEGDEDPEEYYFLLDNPEALLGDDEVSGVLIREEGETVGNYRFLLTELEAPEYYQLKLATNAPTFTILPSPGGPPSFIFYEVLHPVRQEIVRKDGRKLAVILNGQDELTVTYSRMGAVLFGSEDDQPRPLSPMLSYNADTDEVLLKIRGEAEQNKDRGYQTDSRGKPLFKGQYLRLSWLRLRAMHDMGLDGISLNVNGGAVSLRLEDLTGDAAQRMMRQAGFDLKQVKLQLYVIPQESGSPLETLRPITRAWQMRAVLVQQQKEPLDITDRIPSLQAAVDLEEAAALLTQMNRYDETTFPTLVRLLMQSEGQDAAAAEGSFVLPFSKEESKLSDWPALLNTHRYLKAPLNAPAWIAVGVREAEKVNP